MRDSIVEEVRRARDEYARKFNYDLDAICADLRRQEQESGAVVVTLPKRPPDPAALAMDRDRRQPAQR
ncbi:MAG: hypothetical protein WD669_12320 [Pirellulales bacterium]